MTYCAFFDVDETVIQCKSLLESLKFYLGGEQEFEQFMSKVNQYKAEHSAAGRAELNRFFYSCFKGFNHEKMNVACKTWFEQIGRALLNAETVAEIKRHQDAGAEVIFVSGSFLACVKPIAKALGVQHVLCTELEIDAGCYTGRMIKGPIIGEGKSEAILNLANENGFSLEQSYGYGDHISDVPMLSLAKHKIIIGEDQALHDYAREQKWI